MSRITVEWVKDNLPEYLNVIEIPSKGVCGLSVMITTTGLFINLDTDTYEGRYCYHTYAEAGDALRTWDGLSEDPPGNWIKYKSIFGSKVNPNYKSDDDD